jgi:hypothetical protein
MDTLMIYAIKSIGKRKKERKKRDLKFKERRKELRERGGRGERERAPTTNSRPA